MKIALLSGLLILASSASFAATTTLFISRDTTLFQTNADNNLGNANIISGSTSRDQNSRGLLEFDLSSIPSSSVITGVQFQAGLIRQSTSPISSAYSLHRFLKDWTEGVGGAGADKTGSPALTGETTWNSQYFGLTPWSQPGGAAGVEYVSTASAIGPSVNSVGSTYTINSTAQLVADLQLWLDNPSQNHGWMLIASAENSADSARRFSSSELPGSGITPRLIVEYTAIPEPSQGMLLVLGAGGMCCRRSRKT